MAETYDHARGDGRGVKHCRVIQNTAFSEKNFRGYLVPWDDIVPFQTSRVNCISGVPLDVKRGGHAHQIVHEFCVAVSGSMTVEVEDYTGKKSMHISSHTEGAYIAPETWITLKDFTPGTVLMVFCSGEFDPGEVIRTRDAFDAKMAIYTRGEQPPPYKRARIASAPAVAPEDEFIPVNTPLLAGNEAKYLSECATSGWVSSEGSFVKRFEEEMAAHVGRKFAVAVTNGTAAIDIAIDALGIGPGDEVILPALTIISCVTQIARCGAVPVVVDCDASFNMDAALIESKITPKTKAIMAVHIYHFPAEMAKILELAAKYKLKLIEDAAELIGFTYKGKKLGSFGDVSTMSFYPNKHVTTGEGGMVLTDDEALYKKIEMRRNLCFEPPRRFVHKELGWNCRMSNLQAACGVAQLENIEGTLVRKREIGQLYTSLLTGVPGLILPPDQLNGEVNSYWVYAIVLEESVPIDADAFMKKIGAFKIGTRPFFWPIHEQPVLQAMGHFKEEAKEGRGSCPNAERYARRGFYLPSGLALTDAQIRRVTEVVWKLMKELTAK